MIRKKWRFTVATVQKYQPEKFLQFRSIGLCQISSKGYKLNLLTIDDRGILFQITKVIKDEGSNSGLEKFSENEQKL